MTPFVLIGRKKLPSESAPSDEQVYDELLQLWIEKNSGLPLVCCLQRRPQHTQVGETTITATREGADQTERTGLEASQFGETTLTDTREGADRTEGASVQASQFGETVHTRTREGADQAEGNPFRASQLGETTLTKTREGADQAEGAVVPGFDAPHSHF